MSKEPTWWREVFLLYMGKKRQGGNDNVIFLFTKLLYDLTKRTQGLNGGDWQIVLMLGLSLLDLRLKDDVDRRAQFAETAAEIRQWLSRLVEEGQLAPKERAEAGDVLARLGDPRFHSPDPLYLPCRCRDRDEPHLGFVRIKGGGFWIGSNKKDDPQAYDDETV